MSEKRREQAWKAHREGDLERAELIYRNLLEKTPAVDEAINLGALLRHQGRLREAAELYKEWLPRFSNELQLHLNAANCLHELNQHETCAALMRGYLKSHPEAEKVRWALARSLTGLGKFTEAESILRTLTKSNPSDPSNWMDLGVNLHKQGKKPAALECFEKAHSVDAENVIAISNRITMMKDAGQFKECYNLIETLSAKARKDPMVRAAIATMYMAQVDVTAAIKEFKILCELEPTQGGHWLNLAANLRSIKHCNAALRTLKWGICHQPENTDLQQALGQCLAELGKTNKALPVLRNSAGPMASIKDEHLFNIQFLGAGYNLIAGVELQESARLWEDRVLKEDAINMIWADVIREPIKGRRLRVGYLSADWSNHPVCRFMLPILKHHNRAEVEIWGLCSSPYRDKGNEIAKQHCDHWLDLLHASDLEVARVISDLKLDIVVELGGYTGHSRLKGLIYKAAPVQLSYLGYFAPTYLKAIDGWIGDESLFAELSEVDRKAHKLWMVEGGYMAYDPQMELPQIKDDRRRKFRFGSFNHSRKLNPESIALYAKVLRAIPKSELVLKSVSFTEAAEKERIEKALQKAGVEKERLILLDTTRLSVEHLELYKEMDVALDPFHYGGATTSCESLVMGVPVITLAGAGMVGRLSSSILSSAGQGEWIAANEEAYVEIAKLLAMEGVRLKDKRIALRKKILESALCDGKRVSCELERIYREACCATAVE